MDFPLGKVYSRIPFRYYILGMIQTKPHAKAALYWILDLLEKKQIDYLITGGLAANAYGSLRPLADIDLYVPDKNMAELEQSAKPYVISPIHNRRSAFWDIIYMVLSYQEQKIEIVSSHDLNMLDTTRLVWIKQSVDFSRYQWKVIFERKARIMERKDLIAYKRMINRDVDRLDIQNMLS
jgi:hypothetical protein